MSDPEEPLIGPRWLAAAARGREAEEREQRIACVSHVREIETPECRWCGAKVALDADGLCDAKCRALAIWIGWIEQEEERQDGERSSAREREG